MVERKRIFNDFYKLDDHDTQNKHFFGLIERTSPQQCRPHVLSGKRRSNAFCYLIRLSDKDRMHVCRQAFCQIHTISKCRVEVLCKKLASAILLSGDDHGKHKNHPHAVGEELKAQI